MLAPSRNHRAEAKFNVATEFPHLGLHSAAVSGDIGLVQFALNHGQPVNSVLDGVLPLHAACAGGNDLVVNLLIKHGADVNASRLPRRYSDRSRDSAAPIVGTSGATPLHFAAANGHASVVRTLLIHGAHPNRPDKHGITPEIIARQNGWMECADILASEMLARARGDNTPDSDSHSSRERPHPCIDHVESSLRKKLHFKRSIDHALTVLKSASAIPDIDQKPPFVRSGSSEQDVLQPQDSPSSGRRPSLPHIYDEQPQRPSLPKASRRPRSAGTGAEVTSPRKLNSKLSLLSLFKKSNVDASSSSVTSVSEPPINSPPSSPVPVPGTASPVSPAAVISSPRLFPTPLSSSPHETPTHDLHRRRLETNSARASPDPNPWHRSTSSSSTPGEEIPPEPTAPVRPGILRMHTRSTSGHGSQQPPLSRIIRFDNSTSSSTARARSPPSRGSVPHDSRLRALNLGSSTGAPDIDRIPDTIEESPRIPQSPPPILVNAIDLDDLEDEEEEYGVPIIHSSSTPNIMLTPDCAVTVPAQFPFSINVPPPDDSILSSESRLRGDSVSSAGTTGTASTFTQSSASDSPWPPTPHFSDASPLIVSRSMDTDTGINMGMDALPISPHVRRTPSGLDISSISSRAQVEALVQRAQQSVLDMAVDLEENTRRDQGTGRTPLSLRLAMFGESLAIERRMKEEEDAVGKGVLVVDAPFRNGLGVGERSLLSSSRPRAAELSFSRSSSGSGASSEDTSLQHTLRIAPDEIRRAASVDFRRTMSDSPFDGMSRTADNTRRTRSPPVASQHLPLPHDPNQHPHALPLPSPRTQKSFETFACTPPRSRTPDPYDTYADEDTELTGLGIGLGKGLGIPLSRISTAPHAGRISMTRNTSTAHDALTTRNLSPSKRDISLTTSRNIPTTTRNASPATRTTSSSGPRDISSTPATRSVNKLSRMGFSTLEGWQPAPVTTCSPPAKQRFGGIRTIVRGFQGK